MKELEAVKPEPIEIRAEQQQKKEIRLIGQQRKINGLTLWEYNEKTKKLIPAKYKMVQVNIHSFAMNPEEINHIHKVIVNDNCIYFQSLNLKNAQKRVERLTSEQKATKQ